MLAAVEPLLLASDGEKNYGSRKFQLTQHTRAFQAHNRTARIIIRAGRNAGTVVVIAVARVVVPRHQNNALRMFRVCSSQDGIYIRDYRGRRDPLPNCLRIAVGFHFQASGAFARMSAMT